MVGRRKTARNEDRRRTDHATLADSGGTTPEALFTPSDDVARADSVRHATRLGSLLQLAPRVGPLARCRIVPGADRVRTHLEAVSPDVREHRDRDRQRPRAAVSPLGALDRSCVPAAVSRKTDAGSRDSRRQGGSGTQLSQSRYFTRTTSLRFSL